MATLLLVATSLRAEQQFADIGDLELESGEVLEDVRIGYVTAGTLNDDKSNIIVFPTWFTGTAQDLFVAGAVGPGAWADTDRYYVIGIDALANGVSTSPSNSPTQGGAAFPAISIGDMVNSQHRLLTEFLDIGHVHVVMGTSMGGMQTFDWIGRYPDFMDKAIAIDGSLRMTSYDLLAFGAKKRIIEIMREDGRSDAEISAVVGHINLMTLFTPEWFVANLPPEELDAYLARESESVFDSYNYDRQQDAMMTLDIFGGTDESQRAWAEQIMADVLVISGRRDHMVNPTSALRAAQLLEVFSIVNDSDCGHLGNVCESAAVATEIKDFLD